MRIKICGITRPEDALCAEEAGADAIGVVVASETVSRRNVSPGRAREIFEAVGPFTTTVAVTHTESVSDLERVLALDPDIIQIFHPFTFQKKPLPRIIRVIRPDSPLPKDGDAVIVDDSHGKGKIFDLSFARAAVAQSTLPVILAGGLTPENVGDAIRQVRPYAVDVASGVESAPGIKDQEKVRAFVAACRKT